MKPFDELSGLEDLRRCRDFCLRHGFSGFLELNGYAYFRRAVSTSLRPSRGSLHLAPGPSALSPRALASLLLGQAEETAMDVALSGGKVSVVKALGRIGGNIEDGNIYVPRPRLPGICFLGP